MCVWQGSEGTNAGPSPFKHCVPLLLSRFVLMMHIFLSNTLKIPNPYMLSNNTQTEANPLWRGVHFNMLLAIPLCVFRLSSLDGSSITLVDDRNVELFARVADAVNVESRMLRGKQSQ